MTFHLNSGQACIVSDEDKDIVAFYKWRRHRNGYVYRQEGGTKNRKHFILHRLITGAAPGEQVDHRDGNQLNNQRSNLRIATPQVQQFNKPKYKGESRFKGVAKVTGNYGWRAYLYIEGRRQLHIGCYPTEEEAHQAYVRALCEHHGTTLEDWRREHPNCGL
jgi:hypothetical protein